MRLRCDMMWQLTLVIPYIIDLIFFRHPWRWIRKEKQGVIASSNSFNMSDAARKKVDATSSETCHMQLLHNVAPKYVDSYLMLSHWDSSRNTLGFRSSLFHFPRPLTRRLRKSRLLLAEFLCEREELLGAEKNRWKGGQEWSLRCWFCLLLLMERIGY